MSWTTALGSSPDHDPEMEGEGQRQPSNLILITLDTTRADFIGAYGDRSAVTPNIDRLAASGVLYARAITPSPLTLPAHASLLTGLDPPEHGIRDNGRERLADDIPTLATVLSAHDFSTAAFVSSRVLDRRFGLARGFAVYDDRMAAEHVGEYGYAERDAAAVTDRALEWLTEIERGRPFFLWVHYYDPHSPYEPPRRWRRGGSPGADYRGEITFMDHHLGRLLAALPSGSGQNLVAIAGDHGESLGEHGERTHGIFLYRPVLEVPLIIAGPGLPQGRRVTDVVSTRQLAPTLLRLIGLSGVLNGPGLPGLMSTPTRDDAQTWVYSESHMPANAYGWAPLKALTGQKWRLVVAPRPELYDVEHDPAEQNNLIAAEPSVARQLQDALTVYEQNMETRQAQPIRLDSELVAALESLGYVDGAPMAKNDGIDPKDGLSLLASLERAKIMTRNGAFAEALEILTNLSARNPHNLPILTHLARAQLETGDAVTAIATYRKALSFNSESEFLTLNLARALERSGQSKAAVRAYRQVLAIDPRSAEAWLHLVELAEEEGATLNVLREAVAAETDSTLLLTQLAEFEFDAGNLLDAENLLSRASRLTPDAAGLWFARAQVAESRGRPQESKALCQRALSLDRENLEWMLHLGRIHLRLHENEEGRRLLDTIARAAPNSASGRAARVLLDGLSESRDGS